MRRYIVPFVCFIFAVAGCTSDPARESPPPPAGWPTALNDLTVSWTADQGVDLTTGPAVVVRAYIESYILAYLTDDQKYLYPGFRDAVDASASGKSSAAKALWPESHSAATWVGTARHHLLRVTRSGQDVTVLGCLYTYGTGRYEDGAFKANGAGIKPNSGIQPLRIMLRAPEKENSDLPPQKGPSRAPFTNVFDGWRVTGYEGGYFATGPWADSSDETLQCVSRAERPPESRDFKPWKQYPRSDFPTLPATPGWPDKPSA